MRASSITERILSLGTGHDGGLTLLSRAARKAVIDIGSNSVRLVVYEGASRAPTIFYNEKISAQLGLGIEETGKLDPERFELAIRALQRFSAICRQMKVGAIYAIATAALRQASDGQSFIERAKKEIGLSIDIISGEEEATLAAKGVVAGDPDAYGVVCDMGGSSMELVQLTRDGQLEQAISLPLGHLKLRHFEGSDSELRAHISRQLEKAMGLFAKANHPPLYLVGGAWRTIARVDMERQDYPLKLLHDYRLSEQQLEATEKWFALEGAATLFSDPTFSNSRLQALPATAVALGQLLHMLQPGDIIISSFGIREGLLLDQLNKKTAQRDPLIAAARHDEKMDARNPGAGREVYRFIEPLFTNLVPSQKRLIRAASHLHDVTWRAHPEYRAQLSFDHATQASLVGISHKERLILGLMLLHRYKNRRPLGILAPYLDYVDTEDVLLAERVGKAMRFASMLSFVKLNKIASIELDKPAEILRLRLAAKSQHLLSAAAMNRLEQLARAFSCEARAEII